VSFLIASVGHQAIIMRDVAIHPAQGTEVSWNAMTGMNQAQAIQTRQQFLIEWRAKILR